MLVEENKAMHQNITDGFVGVRGDLQAKLETVNTDVNAQMERVDRSMQGSMKMINGGLDTTQDRSKK